MGKREKVPWIKNTEFHCQKETAVSLPHATSEVPEGWGLREDVSRTDRSHRKTNTGVPSIPPVHRTRGTLE